MRDIPLKTDAFGCVFQKDSAIARQQSDELMSNGWRFQIPTTNSEPWQWQWRSPPKKITSKGRLYLSTSQAFNALKRMKIGEKK